MKVFKHMLFLGSLLILCKAHSGIQITPKEPTPCDKLLDKIAVSEGLGTNFSTLKAEVDMLNGPSGGFLHYDKEVDRLNEIIYSKETEGKSADKEIKQRKRLTRDFRMKEGLALFHNHGTDSIERLEIEATGEEYKPKLFTSIKILSVKGKDRVVAYYNGKDLAGVMVHQANGQTHALSVSQEKGSCKVDKIVHPRQADGESNTEMDSQFCNHITSLKGDDKKEFDNIVKNARATYAGSPQSAEYLCRLEGGSQRGDYCFCLRDKMIDIKKRMHKDDRFKMPPVKAKKIMPGTESCRSKPKDVTYFQNLALEHNLIIGRYGKNTYDKVIKGCTDYKEFFLVEEKEGVAPSKKEGKKGKGQ